MEVLGEGQPAHQVAREVAPATSTRSGQAWLMWLTGAPGLPICITARRRYGARRQRQVPVARRRARCARVLAVGRDRGDVALHRGVDGRAVLRREQVEQQAAGDRDPEARLGPGLGLVAALRDRIRASGSTQRSTIPSRSGRVVGRRGVRPALAYAATAWLRDVGDQDQRIPNGRATGSGA